MLSNFALRMKPFSTFFRRFPVVLALLLWGPTLALAQQFAVPWVACADADSGRTVWFRQQYIEPLALKYGLLTVATTGQVQVRMNGRNIAPLLRMPHREAQDTAAIALTFDVSAFVRPDTNTILVWYAPSSRKFSRRQLSLNFYGEDELGQPFSRLADADWQCRLAPTRLLPGGGELTDGSLAPNPWAGEDDCPMLWQPVEECPEQLPFAPTRPQGAPVGDAVEAIVQPRWFDLEGDTVVYDFSPGFSGLLRLTLRGATKGQHVSAAGLSYVCSGVLDEQALGRFGTTEARRVAICGDPSFHPDQLERVEALSVRAVHSFRWPDWRTWSE